MELFFLEKTKLLGNVKMITHETNCFDDFCLWMQKITLETEALEV